MKVEHINDKYFGSDPAKRYLISALKGCAENIVTTEVLLCIQDEVKAKHTCINNQKVFGLCSYCETYGTIVDAHLDATFLSARLIFSRGESALANDFIRDVQNLDNCCIEQYYSSVYDFDFTGKGELQELQKIAKSIVKKIKIKYKSIEKYQEYKFHQPSSQVVSNVTNKEYSMPGLKLNLRKIKPKQTNNTENLLDMLVDLSNLIHRYTHLVSLPNNINWQIPVQSIVESTILLFSVDVSQEKQSKIISEYEKFIELINKMLNCRTGLENHNRLQSQKLSKKIKV